MQSVIIPLVRNQRYKPETYQTWIILKVSIAEATCTCRGHVITLAQYCTCMRQHIACWLLRAKTLFFYWYLRGYTPFFSLIVALLHVVFCCLLRVKTAYLDRDLCRFSLWVIIIINAIVCSLNVLYICCFSYIDLYRSERKKNKIRSLQ